MSCYYESEDDKIVWWLHSDVVDVVRLYREEPTASIQVRYDASEGQVVLTNNIGTRFWVCQFKYVPTPEEVEAAINLVKAKYL